MRRTAAVEIRETDGMIVGTMVTEGRAASGGRRELFTPGSVSWPATGVGILPAHFADPEVRAFPSRGSDGAITLRAKATKLLREAVAAGRRWMSVEFVALEERTTKGGVREILSAIVPAVALTNDPEYDSTAAELRSRKRRRVWL